MPAAYQGTLFRSIGSPLLDLATPEGTTDRTQRRSLDLLKGLNEEHLKLRPEDTELAARIESYELAFRMQTEAAEIVDLTRAGQINTKVMLGEVRELDKLTGGNRAMVEQMAQASSALSREGQALNERVASFRLT